MEDAVDVGIIVSAYELVRLGLVLDVYDVKVIQARGLDGQQTGKLREAIKGQRFRIDLAGLQPVNPVLDDIALLAIGWRPVNLYFKVADIFSFFFGIIESIGYNMGLDLLDIADADDRIPVFGGDVLDNPPAIEPELKDVGTALAVIYNAVLGPLPEQVILDDPLEGSQLIILVCRYLGDLAGHQVGPEP